MVDLTPAEAVALETCLNYDNREGQLCDNFSNGSLEEFAHALYWNKHQVAGLMSSLEQKGLAYADTDGVNGYDVDIVWITEKGVNAIFDHLEAQPA